MKVVVEFNGYYDSDKKYQIKEFSIIGLDRLGKEYYKRFGIVKSNPTKFDITKKYYTEYLEKHGIPQTTGNFSNIDFRRELDRLIDYKDTIFVANNIKERLFRTYLNKGIEENESYYDFVSLNELGYKKACEAINICEYHDVSNPNCCANANAQRMKDFVRVKELYSEYRLKAVHILIDFNGYGDYWLQIKEVAMVHLNHKGVQQKNRHYVTKPYRNTPKLDWNTNLYEQKYGILWTTGNKRIGEMKRDLTSTLDYGVFIYVKNHIQKEILNKINHSFSNKIICLEDFGYNINTEMNITKCLDHVKPKTYNCANDNVKLMTDWLLQEKYFCLSKRTAYIQKHGLSPNPSTGGNSMVSNQDNGSDRRIQMVINQEPSVSSQPLEPIRTSVISKSNTGHQPSDYLHQQNKFVDNSKTHYSTNANEPTALRENRYYITYPFGKDSVIASVSRVQKSLNKRVAPSTSHSDDDYIPVKASRVQFEDPQTSTKIDSNSRVDSSYGDNWSTGNASSHMKSNLTSLERFDNKRRKFYQADRFSVFSTDDSTPSKSTSVSNYGPRTMTIPQYFQTDPIDLSSKNDQNNFERYQS